MTSLSHRPPCAPLYRSFASYLTNWGAWDRSQQEVAADHDKLPRANLYVSSCFWVVSCESVWGRETSGTGRGRLRIVRRKLYIHSRDPDTHCVFGQTKLTVPDVSNGTVLRGTEIRSGCNAFINNLSTPALKRQHRSSQLSAVRLMLGGVILVP